NEIPALFDLLDERFGVERGDDVAEQERQQNGSAAVENGGDGRSRDDEAVRMEVAAQAAVNRSRFALRDAHRSRSARSRPTTMRRARAATGEQASGGVTVAMLALTKPSWPATSIAVTTAWCVAFASARIYTGTFRSSPSTRSIAARKVRRSLFTSGRPLTR